MATNSADAAAASAAAPTFGEAFVIAQDAGLLEPGGRLSVNGHTAPAPFLPPQPPPAAVAAVANASTFGEAYDIAQANELLDGQHYPGLPAPPSTNNNSSNVPFNTTAPALGTQPPHPQPQPMAYEPQPTAYDVTDTYSMPRNPDYEPYLRHLMSFAHHRTDIYPKGATFTKEQLLELQPQHIRDWLSKKAFGKVDWSYENGERPVHQRSSSMQFAKKAVSYFMPNKTPHWCNGQGNPTKSDIVNKLIKFVEQCEVRGEGAKSNVKRPLTQTEFRKEMELLAQHKDDLDHSVTFRSLGLWQYHLVGRIDDAANFEMSHPGGHDTYDFALKTKVSWSKNVTDERRCPDQILLGSGDDTYCVLIALGLHLESFLELHPETKYLFTEKDGKNAPKNLKAKYRRTLGKAAWSKDEFKDLSEGEDGDIGTHSKRKLPATYAVACGCTWEEVEIRGRWKGGKGSRVINRYIDVKQLYHDAKVAATLCVGGAVKYVLIEGISDEWLYENVVPSIRRRFPNDRKLCVLLAKALLYICLKSVDESDTTAIPVPSHIRDRVIVAYNSLGLEDDQPVKKVPLHIYRVNETLQIDEVVTVAGGTDGEAASSNITVSGAAGGGPASEMMQTILIRTIRNEQAIGRVESTVLSALSEQRTFTSNQFRVLNNNVRCFGGQIQGSLVRQRPSNRGHRLLRQNESDQAAILEEAAPATLAPMPRHLIVLWREFEIGLDGRKPARRFTISDRNRSQTTRQTYYRRNVIWQLMKRQIASGLSISQAAAEIRAIYGATTSITKISERIAKDKKTYGGYHPSLSA